MEDEEWATTAEEAASSSFVFLYAVDFTELGLEGQLTRDAPVRVLAVRPPVSQCPSPVEHHRVGTSLKEYLRAQLGASPLMRHFILVFKAQPLRLGRRNKHTSLLGEFSFTPPLDAARSS